MREKAGKSGFENSGRQVADPLRAKDHVTGLHQRLGCTAA
jgi:hypothetical protein